jgi:hypothetical protein
MPSTEIQAGLRIQPQYFMGRSSYLRSRIRDPKRNPFYACPSKHECVDWLSNNSIAMPLSSPKVFSVFTSMFSKQQCGLLLLVQVTIFSITLSVLSTKPAKMDELRAVFFMLRPAL